MRFSYALEDLEKVINYLVQQPYKDVHELINTLVNKKEEVKETVPVVPVVTE